MDTIVTAVGLPESTVAARPSRPWDTPFLRVVWHCLGVLALIAVILAIGAPFVLWVRLQ